MHRLHESLPSGLTRGTILVGHVLAQEDWEIVRFPAIAEEDETWPVDTVWGPRHFTRRRGEALHPEREPLGMLEQIRRTIGEYNFAGQYQQAPSPLGGGLVKRVWLRHYAPGELPQSFDRIVQSWDTADKASELSLHPFPPPHAGEGMGGGARAGASRARTFICSTYCAGAWNIRN
jgi:hypothetical protein